MEEYFSTHGKSISISQIEKFIYDQNILIPMEYIKFLEEVNGGICKRPLFYLRQFDFNKKNPNTYIKIDEFLNFQQLVEVWNYTKEELGIFNLIPIADVRGGMLICCKHNAIHNINAELFFYDMDFGVLKLTNTLIDFLNLLISEEDINDQN